MREFLTALHNYRRGLNLRDLARSLAWLLLAASAAVHVYFLTWLNSSPQDRILIYLNHFLRGGRPARLIGLAWRYLRNLNSLTGTARWLDRRGDHSDDLYQNLVELRQQHQPEPVLQALAGQARQRLQANRYPYPRLFGPSQTWLILFAAVGLLAAWTLAWGDFRFALKQLVTNRPESVAYKTSIALSPGNATLGKGQQLVIRVLEPDPRLTHRLWVRWDKNWRELALTDNSYIFPAVESSLEYYAANEVAKSPVYKVQCLDEPFARRWSVTYNYPDYTGLGSAVDTLSYGNIEAFRHSGVILALESNIPVSQAVMRFADGSEKTLTASGATSFSTRLTVTAPQTWYLELTDALGRKSRPEEKTISVIPDQPPEVRILFPGEDVTLNQNLLLPLIVSADDDFGLRDLTLHYQINNQAPQSLLLRSVISSKLLTLDHTFDLKDFGLLPGDAVTYWAGVFDNSPERQSGLSAKFKARFPSIEEIYREIERQEKLRTGELESALQESRELQKDFEQKRRELLKDKEPSWEDKKQLEKILADQQKLSQQVENVADDFENLIQKMQLNDAISAETLQKMQKIHELMQEISNDELREAMSKFEQALQNMRPEELRKAMENFKFSLEDFARKIDQTLQLLESIKKEQALEKALQIAQEMEKMQSALKDKAGDPKQNNEQLAREQQNISEQLENLESALKDTDSLLDPAKDQQIKQELDQLRQELQSGELQQNMNQSRQ
ncbi:MAG TPA: hypothetical protein PKH19_01990, partial [Candidatus Syntrophosphaera sp.]|nr:hypothetical protein [Candidatus Syntrophosphaera sp.]